MLQTAVDALKSDGIKALGLQGDVRDSKTCESWVQQTVQQYGSLSILVNCAAGNFLSNAHELTHGGFKTGGFARLAVLHAH